MTLFPIQEIWWDSLGKDTIVRGTSNCVSPSRKDLSQDFENQDLNSWLPINL